MLIRGKLFGLFCLSVFMLMPLTWAVGIEPQQAGDDSTAAPEVAATDASSAEISAVDEQDQSADIEDEQEEEAGASTRFIPTEEISQDLGVSFPVDI